MAGLIFDIETDIKNINTLLEKIKALKEELSKIDVNVEFNIAKGIEERIKSLLGDVKAIEASMAATTKMLVENQAKINNVLKSQKTSGSNNAIIDVEQAKKEYKDLVDMVKKARKDGDEYSKQLALIDQSSAKIKKDMVEHSKLDINEQNVDYIQAQKQALVELGVERKRVMQSLTNEVKMVNANELSYDELNAKLKELVKTYRSLSSEDKRGSVGRALQSQIEGLQDELKAQDAQMGIYSRHVGNYERAYNGLNVAMTQVLRETPNLAMNLQTYFLAISNNLPILADEIVNVAKESEDWKDVLKEVGKSLFSWQSLLTIGITLLTMYGSQLWEWAQGFTESGRAAKKAAEEQEYYAKVAKKISSSLVEQKMKAEEYYKIATDVNNSQEARTEAAKRLLKEYPNILKGLDAEAIKAGNAAEAYKKLIQQIDLYIKAEALKQMAIDNYKQQYEFDLKNQDVQSFARQNKSFVSTVKDLYKRYSADKIKKIMGGDFSVLPEGSSSRLRFEEQAASGQFKKYKITPEVEKKIDELINFWKNSDEEINNQLELIEQGNRINRDLERIQSQIDAETTLNLGGTNVPTPTDTGKTLEQRQNEILKARQDFADEYIQLLEELQGDISEAQIELLDEGLQKEIKTIRDNGRQEREELKEQLRKYAEEKAKLDKEIWLNSGEDRKEEDYKPAKTIEQYMTEILANPNDKFTQGYNTRLSQIGKQEQNDIDKLLKDTLEQYQDYYAKRQKLSEDFAKNGQDILAIKTMALFVGDDVLLNQAERAFEELNRQYQSGLLSLDFEEFQKTDLWVKGFEDMENVSIHTLTSLKDKLTEFKNVAVATLKDPSEIQTYIDMLKQVEDEMLNRGDSMDNYITAQQEYNTALNEYRTYLASLPPAEQRTAEQNTKLGQLADNLAEKYKKLSDATNKLIADLGAIANEVKGLGNGIKTLGNNFDGAFKDVSNAVGESLIAVAELTTGSINAFVAIKDAFAVTGKGIEAVSQKITASMGAVGAILTIVNTVIQLAKSFINIGDNKREKQIEKLNRVIENSEKAYAKLEKAIEKAYSHDKVDYLSKANDELERQNRLISEQIRMERQNKNSDEEDIKAMQDKAEANRELIEKNKEAMIDAIFGQDIKSAIESFADALTEAWSGQKSVAATAKDYIREMLKQMVVESIKATLQTSQAIENIRKKAKAFYTDEFLSAEEKKVLEQMAVDAANMIESEWGWAKSLFADSASQEGSSRGFEAMNQETADELNGRFTAGIDLLTRILEEATSGRIALTDIRTTLLDKVNAFASSTFSTALFGNSSTTTDLQNILKQMHNALVSIESLNANGLLDLQGLTDLQRRMATAYNTMFAEMETMRRTIENKL
jgi:hypothetical protein